ncbi:MAG: hypothetical protein GVY04_14170 [Cyanobacteria bacterium]|jgi:hypothetical protein|nr:hypothetical protein [Cyanobacteria bacterium GSL.Bin1]
MFTRSLDYCYGYFLYQASSITNTNEVSLDIEPRNEEGPCAGFPRKGTPDDPVSHRQGAVCGNEFRTLKAPLRNQIPENGSLYQHSSSLAEGKKDSQY